MVPAASAGKLCGLQKVKSKRKYCTAKIVSVLLSLLDLKTRVNFSPSRSLFLHSLGYTDKIFYSSLSAIIQSDVPQTFISLTEASNIHYADPVTYSLHPLQLFLIVAFANE